MIVQNVYENMCCVSPSPHFNQPCHQKCLFPGDPTEHEFCNRAMKNLEPEGERTSQAPPLDPPMFSFRLITKIYKKFCKKE